MHKKKCMETDTNSNQSEFVPVSCKYPLVLLVRKSTFDCDFHFSLWRSTLTIHFWFCVLSAIDFVSVGRRSWQVVREAKNAVSVAVKKLKLPWVKLRNFREYIEIAVSKIEIAVSKIEIAVSKIEIAGNKLKLPWTNWNCRDTLGHRTPLALKIWSQLTQGQIYWLARVRKGKDFMASIIMFNLRRR